MLILMKDVHLRDEFGETVIDSVTRLDLHEIAKWIGLGSRLYI